MGAIYSLFFAAQVIFFNFFRRLIFENCADIRAVLLVVLGRIQAAVVMLAVRSLAHRIICHPPDTVQAILTTIFRRKFLVDRLQYIGYVVMDALIYSQLLSANETETFLLTAQNNCAILAWTLQTSLNKPSINEKTPP